MRLERGTEVWRLPELKAELWDGVWAAPSADRHAHAGLQLMRTTEGRASLVFPGGRVSLRPGTLVAIPAGVVHAILPVQGNLWGFQAAYIKPTAVLDLLEGPTGLAQAGPVRTASGVEALEAWDYWHRTAIGKASTTQRRDGLRGVLRNVAVGTERGCRRGPTADARLQTARSLLDRDFADNQPIAEVARVVGLSSEYLSRLFVRWLGVPPHAYRIQRRVQEALRLLARGASLADTAVVSGFVDQPHMTRHFRRVVGITPGRYAAAVKNVQDASDDSP